MLNGELACVSPADLGKLFNYPEDPTEGSHFLVTTRPSQTDPSESERVIASQFVLEQLCERVLKSRLNQIYEFYCTLRDTGNDATAGMLFEHLVHRLLGKGGRELHLHRIKDTKCTKQGDANYVFGNYTKKPVCHLSFPPPPPTAKTVSKDTMVVPQKNTYYRPSEKNFATFDSWILVPHPSHQTPILLAFQMTLNKTYHSVEPTGLEFMDKWAQGFERWLVVVTEQGIQPGMRVPKNYLNSKLEGRSTDEAFPVFHLPLTREELCS